MVVTGVGVPTIDDYVQAYLTSMRVSRMKTRTVSTTAAMTRSTVTTEQVLYGPKGQPIRVVEHPDGGTQVEQGDHLHAVIRPKTTRIHLKGN